MAHHCEAIVVHCIDFRFQKAINDWLQSRVGYNNYDRVSLAGGVFDLAYVLKQVEISNRLHNIKKVILINHEDCGAYGAEGNPERHASDLHQAEQKIKEQYSHLKVELYYLHLTGIFESVKSTMTS